MSSISPRHSLAARWRRGVGGGGCGGAKGRMTISFRLHAMQIISVKSQEYGTKLYYYPLSTNLKRFASQVTRFSKSRSIIFWAPTAAIDVDVVGAIA